jgi:hypothetical protein
METTGAGIEPGWAQEASDSGSFASAVVGGHPCAPSLSPKRNTLIDVAPLVVPGLKEMKILKKTIECVSHLIGEMDLSATSDNTEGVTKNLSRPVREDANTQKNGHRGDVLIDNKLGRSGAKPPYTNKKN